jgi:hypothetical protein
MIQLLHYQMILHLRMFSSGVLLLFILLSFWLVSASFTPEMVIMMFMSLIQSFLLFISLLLIFQVSNVHQVFYSPEAIQFRLARIRNRSLLIGTTLIQITIVAIAVTIPYAIFFIHYIPENGLMATANILLYHVFLAHAAFLIMRLIGSGSMGVLLVFAILFILPVILGSTGTLFQSTPIKGLVTFILDWSSSHLDLTSNPMMLNMRGIQDTEAIFRVLFLTPILILTNYVLFLRKDHH